MLSLITLLGICKYGIIECQILKNEPLLNVTYVKRVARHIKDASYEHGVDGKIYTAILMQESSYSLTAVNCGDHGCDYGIAQIHDKTAKAYDMDVKRLRYDLRYSIMQGARVLSWFKRYRKREPDMWWTRYNCGTRKSVKRETCKEYYRRVRRWL